MRLVPLRIEATFSQPGGEVGSASGVTTGDGRVRVGPLEVDVQTSGTAARPSYSWAIANRGDGALSVRSVSLVLGLADVVEPLRMFCNGYQSWSPSGVAVFGQDVDPSTKANFEFLQAVHHADQRTVQRPEELRSEWVSLLADATRTRVLAGFAAGTDHDGTLRLRREHNGDRAELWAEAFLGGAVIDAGERRLLHTIVAEHGGREQTAAELLGRWAMSVGQTGNARVDVPYQVGWCSWYQYFGSISEAALLGNLALAGDWPFDVFQLDDGYQSAIGDWLIPNEKFPTGLAAVAERIIEAGCRPGIWLAPFLAAPDSRLVSEHPDWLAGHADSGGMSGPLCPWWNPDWGGGAGGVMYGLDTTKPEVLAHLERTAAAFVEMGFTYLKVDFTFAPSVDGVWSDTSLTPAERVRAGFAALRRGAGDGAFILGCGVPLSHVVGLVDANRIGQDVAPLWALQPSDEIIAGYLGVQPATKHAYANTVARSFMHRRLWVNDPDCVMLRSRRTDLSREAARTWAQVVGLSGGMALVSDDLSLLDEASRQLLDEVVSLGRVSDSAALTGAPAVAPDLLAASPPALFAAAGCVLVTDPTTGSSALRPSTEPTVGAEATAAVDG